MADTPAGWYPDAHVPGLLRWWDGCAWTADVHRDEPPATPQQVLEPSPEPAPRVVRSSAVSVPSVALGDPKKRGLFGARKAVEAENEHLRDALARTGLAERDAIAAEITVLRDEIAALAAQRDVIAADVIATSEAAVLQEVGIYAYRHPLTDALAYKDRLEEISTRIKELARSGDAVTGDSNWTVNGSKAKGTKMIREYCKLMLRAYNNEADNAVRAMKPYMLESSTARLDKARATISRLGSTMSVVVSDNYHRLRIAELELTADYLAKVAEEKERDREEKARLREEAIARKEYEREQARLEKEQAHYRAALEALQARGDMSAAAETEAKLAEIADAIEGVARRAANARAGYVYIISNIGAFGDRMVKVGLTRRLDPMDRVRELGDASVPFRYDVHAMIFSDDAVTLETQLHRALDDRRVNRVNSRREFFYAAPAEIRLLLQRFSGNLLSYVDEPEAVEWRQSRNAAGTSGSQHAAPPAGPPVALPAPAAAPPPLPPQLANAG